MLKKFVKVKDKNKDQTNEITKQESTLCFQKYREVKLIKLLSKLKMAQNLIDS